MSPPGATVARLSSPETSDIAALTGFADLWHGKVTIAKYGRASRAKVLFQLLGEASTLGKDGDSLIGDFV